MAHSIATLHRLETTLHELLAYDTKIDAKPHGLLHLLEESVRVRRRLERRERERQAGQQQTLQQTVEQLEEDKKLFEEIQEANEEKRGQSLTYEKAILDSTATLFSAAHLAAQVENLIHAANTTKQALQLLAQIHTSLRDQFQDEASNMAAAQQDYRGQQALLEAIHAEIREEVESKTQQARALKVEAERSQAIELENKRQYQDALQQANSLKVQRIHQEEEVPRAEDAHRQTHKDAPQDMEGPAEDEAQVEFKLIELPPSYHHEKLAAAVLFLLTLILLACLNK